MGEFDRAKHGFDVQEGNLINCPNDPAAPWVWDVESELDDTTNFPPFCPACGQRVKVWQVTGEFSDDPVLLVPSAQTALEAGR